MIIRIANENDKNEILRLMDNFARFLQSDDIPSKIGKEILDEVLKRTDIKIFVAEEENKLIGLATFYLLPNIRHGFYRGHIEDFYVDDSMQGKGVGSEIMNAIKKYCLENNIKVIKLDSAVELTESHKFYERHGGEFTEKMFNFDL